MSSDTDLDDCQEQSDDRSHSHSSTAGADEEPFPQGGTDELPDDKETLKALLSKLTEDLKPLTPEEGVERYLRHRTGITSATLDQYRTTLNYFLEFADQNGIRNLNTLSGREIAEYRAWRREESTDEVETLSPGTMQDDLYFLRDFLWYLEKIDAVSAGLGDKVVIPDCDNEGRDIELPADRLRQILSHLEKFEYATIDHVLFCLLKETGRRIGGIQALDLEDYHRSDNGSYLEFRHRPGETRLKNETDGEAQVTLAPAVGDVLDDYIEANRHDVVDEHGRQPLLTTSHGRPAKSTLRRYVYKWTRPCQVDQSCPHGKTPETCDAAQNANSASKCESSRSPHALRHSHLTELRRSGVPIEVIETRCDVSREILEKHYDERSEEEKRQRRKEILEAARDNGGGYL